MTGPPAVAGPAPDPPSLVAVGRRYLVRSRQPGDDRLAAALSADPDLAGRLLLAEGGIPLAAARRFVDGCFHVLHVESRRSGRLAGAVLVTSAQVLDRHCFVTVGALPWARGPSLFFEGVLLALDLVFARWGFQRVRFDVLEPNLAPLRSATRFADGEGVRRDWAFVGGRWWDAHLFAVTQATWREHGAPRAARLRAGP